MTEAGLNFDFDVADLSQSEKVIEDNQTDIGPGSSNASSGNSSTMNDDSENKEQQIDQPQALGLRSIGKHSSYYPMESLTSPLNS